MTIIFDKLNEDLIVRENNDTMYKEIILDFIKDFCLDYRVRFLKCIAVDNSLYIEVEYVNRGEIFFAKTSGFVSEALTVFYFLLDIVRKTGINNKNTIYRVYKDKEVYVYANDGLSLLKCLNLLNEDNEGFFYFIDEKTYQNLYFD